MTKLQIVRIGYPRKGNLIKDQMSELCQTPAGEEAMTFQWDRIFFPKKELFVFHRDVVAARVATDEEVKTQAKLGAFGMATSSVPLGGLLGLAVSLAAGAVGGAVHSAGGMKGVLIRYTNPQGQDGFMLVIGDGSVIDRILKSIPVERIEK